MTNKTSFTNFYQMGNVINIFGLGRNSQHNHNHNPDPNWKQSLANSLKFCAASAGVYLGAVAAAVGVTILLQNVFALFMGPLSTFFTDVALPTLIASIIQGALAGAGAVIVQKRLGRGQPESQEQIIRNNDWLKVVLGGALTAGTLYAMSIGIHIHAIAGGGPGDPPLEFVPTVFYLVVVILFSAVASFIVFTVVAGGLRAMGLGITAELVEDKGKSLGQKWANGSKEASKNPKITFSSTVTGMVTGAATFHLEVIYGSGHGFFWQVFVEFFGASVSLVVGGLILGFILHILDDPQGLLKAIGEIVEIVWTFALFIGIFLLIAHFFGSCSSSSGSGPYVPFRPP